MRPFPTRNSAPFVLTDDEEDSYDATAFVAPDLEPAVEQSETSRHPQPPGAEEPIDDYADEPLPEPGPRPASSPRSRPSRPPSSRAKIAALAAIIACPILIAVIGLLTLDRIGSIASDVLRPAEPIPIRTGPPRHHQRRRAPAPRASRTRTPHRELTSPRTHSASRRTVPTAIPHHLPRSVVPAQPQGRSPRLIRSRAKAPPPPREPRSGGEFVLGG